MPSSFGADPRRRGVAFGLAPRRSSPLAIVLLVTRRRSSPTAGWVEAVARQPRPSSTARPSPAPCSIRDRSRRSAAPLGSLPRRPRPAPGARRVARRRRSTRPATRSCSARPGAAWADELRRIGSLRPAPRPARSSAIDLGWRLWTLPAAGAARPRLAVPAARRGQPRPRSARPIARPSVDALVHDLPQPRRRQPGRRAPGRARAEPAAPRGPRPDRRPPGRRRRVRRPARRRSRGSGSSARPTVAVPTPRCSTLPAPDPLRGRLRRPGVPWPTHRDAGARAPRRPPLRRQLPIVVATATASRPGWPGRASGRGSIARSSPPTTRCASSA